MANGMYCAACQCPLIVETCGAFECKGCGALSADGMTWCKEAPVQLRSTEQLIRDWEALREENAQLKRDRERLLSDYEVMKRTAISFRDEKRVAHEQLDRLSRFVAGLPLQDHPLAVQRERHSLVHDALSILNPPGEVADTMAPLAQAVASKSLSTYANPGANSMPSPLTLEDIKRHIADTLKQAARTKL